MPFVLDASVSLAWAFEDETTEYTDRILAMFESDHARVPSIWVLQVANVLLGAERRRRIRDDEQRRFVELLASLPIRVDDISLLRALGSVLDVARPHRLTAYDASYLELALREGLPLATQDKHLRDAAQRVGASLLE